jgi:Tol biopolymer transport system component
MKKVWLITGMMLILFSSYLNAGVPSVSRPVRLAGGDAGYQFMRPIWSPDGTKIAFTGPRYNGIWVINADGTDERRITGDLSSGYGFQWSSDSRTILARASRYEKYRRLNAIILYDVDTATDRLVSEYRTSSLSLPVWGDGGAQIMTIHKNRLEVYNSGMTNDVLKKAPADRRMFLIKEDRIAEGDPVTNEYRVVISLKDRRCINLVYSPDGSKIAFEEVGGNLFVMNLDDGRMTDLGRGHRPQWSPDSQYLTYMITEDDGYRYTSSDIYLIKVDGTEKNRLEFRDDKLEMNPSWSPDGKKIAYDVYDEGAVYIVEIDQ